MCVCVCVPSFSVLAAATFKKLSPIDKHFLSPSIKWQKPVVSQKVCFEMLSSYSLSARASNDRASQDFKKI